MFRGKGMQSNSRHEGLKGAGTPTKQVEVLSCVSNLRTMIAICISFCFAFFVLQVLSTNTHASKEDGYCNT
jgi:hypothetical protein